MNSSELLDDIAAKSDQLNAVELTAPVVATVTGFERRKGQAQPWLISLDIHAQPWKPCKTMRRALLKFWGDNPEEWVGRKLRLFADPNCKYAGEMVEGIRISGMSHLTETVTWTAEEWKGKGGRKTYVFEPLSATPKPAAKKAVLTVSERVDAACKAYEACNTVKRLEALDSHIDALFSESDAEQQSRITIARDAAVDRVQNGGDQ
jgi:hypothetical protein